MLHGTVSLQDTRGRWVEVGSAARTVVRGQTLERLHLLARIWAQAEPYRLEVRTAERPDAAPLGTYCRPALPRAPVAARWSSIAGIPVMVGD